MKKWGYLKKFCIHANWEIFLRLYKTYLLPILEYASLCWIPSNTQLNNIESVRRKITKFISFKNGISGLTYTQRLQNLNLEPLKIRRYTKCLIIVFKCINHYNTVPNLWKNIFKFKSTRNGLILDIPITRLKFCDKNFFINSMYIFNNLPIFIRNEKNLSLFTQNVKQFLINYFND